MFGRRNREKQEEKPKVKFNRETLREGLRAFQFIKPYRWQFIIGMILLAFSALTFMIFPYLIGEMVNLAEGDSDLNINLGQAGLALIGILAFQGIVSYSRVMLFAVVSENGIADIRRALYQKLISLPITFFEENQTGELISRTTADVEKLYNTFSITLAEFLRQIIIILVGIILILFMHWELSLVMLMTVPVVMVSAIFIGRNIRKMSKKRQEELADSNSLLGESLQSIQVVKAFAMEMFEVNRYSRSIDKVVKVSMKYASARALFALFIITIMFGAIFFVLWRGAVMIGEGTLTSGDLIAFGFYTIFIGGAIASLGSLTPEILGAIGATDRVFEILETPNEVELEESTKSKEVLESVEGNVNFEQVHFTYPTRPDIPVLKGIDIEIKAGQKIALVGPSGVGKSTIIQLLLRFYAIQEGDIKLDGKSIFDINLRTLRNVMAFVPQEVILFGGSIRENILYGKEDASEEEVIQAAKQSNSWEFIQEMPEGLETLIGERGVKLSGGQRQRIAIARALLKNPKILLLDEATSALDAESEKVVQDALETLMEGRTSIIIAHRLNTIREVDCIYVLGNGQVVEQGTHEELSALEEGKYQAQARLQFSAE
ncbi:MAG: ABC transporter transmembrane domain-containing protein [Bacteroidota bacterium]